ncbi:MAG TPA: hypothetical protein VE574_04240 [Nitrososphaeraceae archaeon]|nr:hypothetical protein [Nitrososphaeraceae archaeon]
MNLRLVSVAPVSICVRLIAYIALKVAASLKIGLLCPSMRGNKSHRNLKTRHIKIPERPGRINPKKGNFHPGSREEI